MNGLIKASQVDGLVIGQGWWPLEVSTDVSPQLLDIWHALCRPASFDFIVAVLSSSSCRQHALIRS